MSFCKIAARAAALDSTEAPLSKPWRPPPPPASAWTGAGMTYAALRMLSEDPAQFLAAVLNASLCVIVGFSALSRGISSRMNTL